MTSGSIHPLLAVLVADLPPEARRSPTFPLLIERLDGVLRRGGNDAELLRPVFEHTFDGVVAVGSDGRLLWANPAACWMYGYEPEDLVGQPVTVLDDPTAAMRPSGFFARSDHQPVGEGGGRRRNGATFTVGVAVSSIGSGPRGLRIGVLRDVSEQRSVVDALRRSNDELEARVRARTAELEATNQRLERARAETEGLLASISAILIGLDPVGRITRWNAAAAAAFARNATAMLGADFLAACHDWQVPALSDALGRCRSDGRLIEIDDLRVCGADGSERVLHVRLDPAQGGDGSCLILATDVTDRRRLEGQLRQAQKLESIGQLAAGIAHEINTPIQFIGDNLDFLAGAASDLLAAHDAMEAALDGCGSALPIALADAASAARVKADVDYLRIEMPKAITDSREGAANVARLVLALKEFAHPETALKQPIDLNRALENTLMVARNEWSHVATVVSDLAADLPPVPCLPGEIGQVFLNLIVNAAHAITDVVGTSGALGCIRVATAVEDGWVVVRIADTGFGIPRAIRERIFDPFFTTKEVGKGTGQGLYIAREIVVRKHGGTIDFVCGAHQGTTFVIRLPL